MHDEPTSRSAAERMYAEADTPDGDQKVVRTVQVHTLTQTNAQTGVLTQTSASPNFRDRR